MKPQSIDLRMWLHRLWCIDLHCSSAQLSVCLQRTGYDSVSQSWKRRFVCKWWVKKTPNKTKTMFISSAHRNEAGGCDDCGSLGLENKAWNLWFHSSRLFYPLNKYWSYFRKNPVRSSGFGLKINQVQLTSRWRLHVFMRETKSQIHRGAAGGSHSTQLCFQHSYTHMLPLKSVCRHINTSDGSCSTHKVTRWSTIVDTSGSNMAVGGKFCNKLQL